MASTDCSSNKKRFGTIVSLEHERHELFLGMGTALDSPEPNVSSDKRVCFGQVTLLKEPAGPADQHTALHVCRNASCWKFKWYALKTGFCYQKDIQLTRRYSLFSFNELQTYPHVEFPAFVPWFDLEDVIGSRVASCCLHLKDVRRHGPPGHHVHHSVQDGEWLISAAGVFSWTHAAANCQREDCRQRLQIAVIFDSLYANTAAWINKQKCCWPAKRINDTCNEFSHF